MWLIKIISYSGIFDIKNNIWTEKMAENINLEELALQNLKLRNFYVLIIFITSKKNTSVPIIK